MEQFKPRADFGNLHATTSKMHEKAPDYFGEIAINLKDLTNVRVEDGLHIFKLGGWKLQAKSGKTYLSIKVDRFIPKAKDATQSAPVNDLPDEDIPF
jgi:hypothetical protein